VNRQGNYVRWIWKLNQSGFIVLSILQASKKEECLTGEYRDCNKCLQLSTPSAKPTEPKKAPSPQKDQSTYPKIQCNYENEIGKAGNPVLGLSSDR
jgi:hypothetical protein